MKAEGVGQLGPDWLTFAAAIGQPGIVGQAAQVVAAKPQSGRPRAASEFGLLWRGQRVGAPLLFRQPFAKRETIFAGDENHRMVGCGCALGVLPVVFGSTDLVTSLLFPTP